MLHERTWSRLPIAAVVAGAVALTPSPSQAREARGPAGCPDASGRYPVGHTTRSLVVPGAFDPQTLTSNEQRPIQVQLWYPARDEDACPSSDAERPDGCRAPLAAYTSRLNGALGDLLAPLGWEPLSWSIAAAGAREDAHLAEGDRRFPVVVFSHGNQNNAIDHAYMLEALASHGYVVAAPDHLNNTQDEVRIDHANAALAAAHRPLIPCLDGAPPDVGPKGALLCSRPGVPKSMVDRQHDVQAVLDALPGWFGDRIDLARVGMLGHSRGTVTALAMAGGSAAWGAAEDEPFLPDARIKAVMGLAIGMQAVTSPVDVQNVTVPVLLVGGTRDASGPLAVSEWAIANLTSLAPADKQLVVIQGAYHRHFDSAYCAELQSAGGIARDDPNAAMDLQTTAQILYHPTSGLAVDYCPLAAFTTPKDITALAQTVTAGSIPGFTFPSSVPTSGLTTGAVMDEVVGLAVAFFGQVLNRGDGDARPILDCLPDAGDGSR